jgi:hypothetical protein
VRAATEGQEEPIAEELAEFRGSSKKDEAVHTVIGWATLKDYPIHVGISIEVPDQVGNDTHEIQLREESTYLPQGPSFFQNHRKNPPVCL